jgi:hypothetical protein
MSYTYDKNSAYGLIKAGEYEVMIQEATIKTTPSGKEKISLKYKIREDVEQESKGRIIFEDIWKEKDNPQFFNRKRLNLLLRTQDIENGKTYEAITDLLTDLAGSYLILKITVEMDDYRGEEVNRVIYYRHTHNPSQSVNNTPLKEGQKPVTKATPIKDEDLPF